MTGPARIQRALELRAHHHPRHLRDIYLNEYGIADLRG